MAIIPWLGWHSRFRLVAPAAVPLTIIDNPAPGNIWRLAVEFRTFTPLLAEAVKKLVNTV